MHDFFVQMTGAVHELGAALMRHGLYCATAESCTGGLAGATLTHVPGSSRWFKGGVIAYDNQVKHDLLQVSVGYLEQYGAVSHPVVRQMALGACAVLNAPMAVALSGVAGPDGGNETKPVGTVYLGVALYGVAHSFRYTFAGDREAVRYEAVRAAVWRLHSMLWGYEGEVKSEP